MTNAPHFVNYLPRISPELEIEITTSWSNTADEEPPIGATCYFAVINDNWHELNCGIWSVSNAYGVSQKGFFIDEPHYGVCMSDPKITYWKLSTT